MANYYSTLIQLFKFTFSVIFTALVLLFSYLIFALISVALNHLALYLTLFSIVGITTGLIIYKFIGWTARIGKPNKLIFCFALIISVIVQFSIETETNWIENEPLVKIIRNATSLGFNTILVFFSLINFVKDNKSKAQTGNNQFIH